MFTPGRCVAAAIAVLATAAGAVVTLTLTAGHHPQRAGSAAVAAPERGTGDGQPAGWTQIVTVRTTVPRYASPDGRPDGVVAAQWYGASSVLPVTAQRPGWVKVELATRPNGSTAWIRRGAGVTMAATPYRITISLSARRLRLFHLGKLVMSAPAGIGTAQYPTPTGTYFVAFFEGAPSAGYGPFIIVTSAHSPVIGDWDDSGDAVIGIHGPLGQDTAIGTAGARITHGCVRLHDADLARLRDVPAGTPVVITA